MGISTTLYEQHKALGGTFTEFAGYSLPVMYTGITEEHLAVRRSAGLFDVSHMGEIVIKGEDVLANLNNILTNDFTDMRDGAVRYTLMCNEQGGVIDDLVVYSFSPSRFLLVPNAVNTGKVFDFLVARLTGNTYAKDCSKEYGQIALQGPKSRGILAKITDGKTIPSGYYSFVQDSEVGGICCTISKTGYTGESGFELFCQADKTPDLWAALLAAGKDDGLITCGLGARDTLRLEAGMPLYGHEISEDISPLEAGLGSFVKMSKPDFIGKKALLDRGAPERIRVGLKVTGKGIIRENCPVFKDGKKIGIATSGTYLPYLGGAYAMALIGISDTAAGTSVCAEVRGRLVPAEIVPLPFYRSVIR